MHGSITVSEPCIILGTGRICGRGDRDGSNGGCGAGEYGSE